MKGLPHTVVSDLTKSSEGGLSGDGTEAWMGLERLEKLGGSHGFGKSEDAAWMILRDEEIDPLVDIVLLQEAISGERATANAVGAAVGEEHCESVSQKELRVSSHPNAIVAKAVEKKYDVAVFLVGMNFPCAQDDAVGRGDGDVSEFGLHCENRLAGFSYFVLRERAPGRVKCAVGEVDASRDAESRVQDES